jgi:RNA-dependent RNA polymerase
VAVCKNPCTHPGGINSNALCIILVDFRLLEAVNIPALSHIKDCIVFPTKGDRPHSDEVHSHFFLTLISIDFWLRFGW